MSVIALFAMSAAFAVSPPKPDSNDAEKLVTFSMYSFADRPAVLKAFFALFTTVSALLLNNVSTPPKDCSSAAPSPIAAFSAAPIPAAAIAVLIFPTRPLPTLLPASIPAESASPLSASFIFPLIPCADGMICTYAVPSLDPAIYSPPVIFFHIALNSLPVSNTITSLSDFCPCVPMRLK